MNKLILAFITFLIIIANSADQWEILNEGCTWGEIDFVNEEVGWLAGGTTLLKTEDGAETWNSLSLDKEMYFYQIDFVSESIGWGIVGIWDEEERVYRVKIIKSIDGGHTWNIQKEFTDQWVNEIYAVSESLVYGVGEFGIIKSYDGGENWIDLSPNLSNRDFGFIWPINKDTFIVLGSFSDSLVIVVSKTFDGGENWDEEIIAEFSRIYDIQIVNDSTAYFKATKDSEEWGREHFFCKTTDTLNTWTTIYKSDENTQIQCYYAFDYGTIFTVLEDSLFSNVMKSIDGGGTWDKIKILWWWAFKIHFISKDVGIILEDPWCGGAINIYRTSDKGDNWNIQKFGQNLNDVYFINKIDGFTGAGHVIGGRHIDPFGNLFVTNDGGKTWRHNYDHPAHYITSCFFLNDHIGFTLARDNLWKGYIHKTVDNGKNWSVAYKDNYDSAGYNFIGNDMYFTNDEIGWALGGGSWGEDSTGAEILGTYDGGENWDLIWKFPDTDIYTYRLNSIHAIGEKAWAVGESGLIVKYTEKNQWQTMPHFTDLPLNDVFFSDENHGWIAGGYIDEDNKNLKLFKTIDGGENWEEISNFDYQINDMFFENNLHGWAVGNDTSYYGWWWELSDCGVILETIDGGMNWTVQAKDLIAPLNAIYFKDGYGWAVGNFGLVLRTDDGSTWVDQNTIKSYPKKFSLSQNYPNPFNPSTTIEFYLPKTSAVILKIFNILGEEVATLVSDRLSAGIYAYEWNASKLASGVYLYRLEAGGFFKTRKMVLMR